MKTRFTQFAIAMACCISLVSSCKKDSSDPDPAPVQTTTPTANYLMLGQNKYTAIFTDGRADPSINQYQISCIGVLNRDTLTCVIAFNTIQPTIGAHSLNMSSSSGFEDAFLFVEHGDKVEFAMEGNCTLSKENGKYKVVFNDIDIIDDSTGATIFKLSGNILTQ